MRNLTAANVRDAHFYCASVAPDDNKLRTADYRAAYQRHFIRPLEQRQRLTANPAISHFIAWGLSSGTSTTPSQVPDFLRAHSESLRYSTYRPAEAEAYLDMQRSMADTLRNIYVDQLPEGNREAAARAIARNLEQMLTLTNGFNPQEDSTRGRVRSNVLTALRMHASRTNGDDRDRPQLGTWTLWLREEARSILRRGNLPLE